MKSSALIAICVSRHYRYNHACQKVARLAMNLHNSADKKEIMFLLMQGDSQLWLLHF